MSSNNINDIANLSAKTMYRLFMKNMIFYPSKNRFQILMAIKEEFRDNIKITDEKKMKVEM